MDRFQLINIFVAVAEEESFSAAARRLQISAPAVTRAVLALEDRLGVKLLIRTTRIVRVTEAGARYLEDARRIMLELEEADEAAAGNNATPRGQLAVTAPVLFGKLFVMPIVAEYQSTYEQTTVSALFVDRVVNFIDEGMDVGIRIGPLPDSLLRAIRVGQVRRVVCAAPDYLKKHGIPQKPDDLKEHRIVASTSLSPTSEWAFVERGERINVQVQARIQVNTNDGALEAACHGFGLTRLLSYQVAALLDSGQLKTVLSNYEGPTLPVHVIHREGRHGSAKVRSFVDLVVDRLRANKALN